MIIRTLKHDEWEEIAELIYLSLNSWYEKHVGRLAFPGSDPQVAMVYPEVYEKMDPGCCLVAVSPETGRLAGSCFYHPRSTHVALGIMNVHPDCFGRGVGRQLLAEVLRIADEASLPVRLVSSALNLDSYSLYTRAGFVPRMLFQTMIFSVPEEGPPQPPDPGVRPATPDDIRAMTRLEAEICGIERSRDHEHFIENEAGIWNSWILEEENGRPTAFLHSIDHPARNVLGPGVARTEEDAAALLNAAFHHYAGRSPVLLVPANADKLVADLYSRGARNRELHVAQVRGDWMEPSGIVLGSIMPETG